MRILLIEAPYHDLYARRDNVSFRRYLPLGIGYVDAAKTASSQTCSSSGSRSPSSRRSPRGSSMSFRSIETSVEMMEHLRSGYGLPSRMIR